MKTTGIGLLTCSVSMGIVYADGSLTPHVDLQLIEPICGIEEDMMRKDVFLASVVNDRRSTHVHSRHLPDCNPRSSELLWHAVYKSSVR
jgi:hypothetical protein